MSISSHPSDCFLRSDEIELISELPFLILPHICEAEYWRISLLTGTQGKRLYEETLWSNQTREDR